MLHVHVKEVLLLGEKLSRGEPLGELPGRTLFRSQTSARLEGYSRERLPLRIDSNTCDLAARMKYMLSYVPRSRELGPSGSTSEGKGDARDDSRVPPIQVSWVGSHATTLVLLHTIRTGV